MTIPIYATQCNLQSANAIYRARAPTKAKVKEYEQWAKAKELAKIKKYEQWAEAKELAQKKQSKAIRFVSSSLTRFRSLSLKKMQSKAKPITIQRKQRKPIYMQKHRHPTTKFVAESDA